MMFDIVRLFTREEEIAGLEIGNDFVRLAVFNLLKGGETATIHALAEEPLENGVVEAGAVKDAGKLTAAIKRAVDKSGVKVNYVIAAIPSRNIYSRIFSFPKILSPEKIEETIKINVAFDLPMQINEVYLDWEKAGEDGKNEIIVSAIRKEIIDGFVKAISGAGLKLIALESNVVSALRVADINLDQTNLIVYSHKTTTRFTITKRRVTRFARFAEQSSSDENLKKEINRLYNFYEAQEEPIARTINYSDISAVPTLKDDPRIKNGSSKWLVALGTGIRALLPRSEDKLISLLPVGTEVAYEHQKALVFIKVLSNITVAFAGVFSGAFILVWLLMTSVQGSFDKGPSSINPSIASGAVKVEERVKEFNNLVERLSQIHREVPMWSRILTELRSNVTAGVVITGASISSSGGGTVNMNAVGLTRAEIRTFRENLVKSSLFAEIQSPASNLDKVADIPFSISFKLRDREELYKK